MITNEPTLLTARFTPDDPEYQGLRVHFDLGGLTSIEVAEFFGTLISAAQKTALDYSQHLAQQGPERAAEHLAFTLTLMQSMQPSPSSFSSRTLIQERAPGDSGTEHIPSVP